MIPSSGRSLYLASFRKKISYCAENSCYRAPIAISKTSPVRKKKYYIKM